MDPKRKSKLCGYAGLSLLCVVIALVIAFVCFKEQFGMTSPLVFTKQLNSMPEGCNPWYGCSWNKVPCKSNQDCESFRRCDEGKCIVPENMNLQN